MTTRHSLSVVVPVYNEETILEELRRRLLTVLEAMDLDGCEVVLVSDGSTDRSEAMIAEFACADPRITGVFLTRNFGHQAAVTVGLQQARGDVVAVIDADLQDPPEHLPTLLAAIDGGADVAYGVRRNRREGPLKRAAYWTFYRILRLSSSTGIALDAGDFCMMTRRVVDAMNRLPETRRFVRGLRSWVGYTQTGVEYDRDARFAGEPKYTIGRLICLAYDGFFSFSRVPVMLMQVVGFATSFLAAVLGMVYLGLTFVVETPRGFPTLMLSVWFLGGVQLLCFGVLGEYVYRTFEEACRRPTALVRQVVGRGIE
jgi:polyisoprenyl-phosphate glycosyltransferase